MTRPREILDESPPEWLLQEDPAGDLAQDILSVCKGGTIRLWVREAPPFLYNVPTVQDALRHAKTVQGAAIHVVAGPMLLIPDEPSEDGTQTNGLLALQAEGVIDEIVHLPDTGGVSPFRIIETEQGYRYGKELPTYDSFRASAPAYRVNPDYHSPRNYQAIIEESILLFDGMLSHLEERADEWGPLPYTITVSNYDRLIEAGETSDIPVDYSHPKDLLKLPGASGLLTLYEGGYE